MKLHSPDLTEANIRKIAEIFPNCVTEIREKDGRIKQAIDYDLLRQELAGHIVEGPQERYHLNWPGKREASLEAGKPITKTLRPVRDESVDFDKTENLFIEGDNLDALKLLQESYLGKVKMIYIDPPYNTGNDFIYKDNFSESTENFFQRSNQKDEEGNRLIANRDSNGRFHSDWLSMIYSRLKVARNLLCDDGVIFISIDDNEQANLRKICDEIFGGNNFIANVIWQRAFSPKSDAKHLSENHDHLLIYAKNETEFVSGKLPRSNKANSRYQNIDNDSRGLWISDNLTVKTYSEKYDYPIKTPSGRIVNPAHGRCWGISKDKFEQLKADNRIWFGADDKNVPRLKRFLSEVQDGMVATTIWFHQDVGHNQEGRQELKSLFDGQGYFDGPKPVRFLSRILKISNANKTDIILDFFAGSGTVAHAVMELNAEDGGNRKFIMVQLPEKCDSKSEATKAGFKNISDIGKERIRLAGKKILEGKCHADWNKDIGFRVFKIDSSNMKEVYYTPDKISQTSLPGLIDNIKPDRTDEDFLFQILIDEGVDLTLSVRCEKVEGKNVYFVDNNALIACFEKGIDEKLVKLLAAHKPLRVAFRDNGFASDAVKINVDQIFKQISSGTHIKII